MWSINFMPRNSCLLLDCGKVISWGRSDYGQLGLGNDVVNQGYCFLPQEILNARHAKQVFFIVHCMSSCQTTYNVFTTIS